MGLHSCPVRGRCRYRAATGARLLSIFVDANVATVGIEAMAFLASRKLLLGLVNIFVKRISRKNFRSFVCHEGFRFYSLWVGIRANIYSELFALIHDSVGSPYCTIQLLSLFGLEEPWQNCRGAEKLSHTAMQFASCQL
jgi:hypothetical protein